MSDKELKSFWTKRIMLVKGTLGALKEAIKQAEQELKTANKELEKLKTKKRKVTK
jgi:hypothetical protein